MIKLFEQFTSEQEIHEICRKYEIENYTINSDGSIDVNGHYTLYGGDKPPIKFNKIEQSFALSDINLETLENLPTYVGGFYDISYNKLTSLEGFPTEVGRDIDVSENELTNLEGIVSEVNGDLACESNKITTLKGFPMVIHGNLVLRNNPIKIIDSSIEVGEDIYLYGTEFDDRIKELENEQDKLKLLFEHGVDYNIFNEDGTIRYKRLLSLFKDFGL